MVINSLIGVADTLIHTINKMVVQGVIINATVGVAQEIELTRTISSISLLVSTTTTMATTIEKEVVINTMVAVILCIEKKMIRDFIIHSKMKTGKMTEIINIVDRDHPTIIPLSTMMTIMTMVVAKYCKKKAKISKVSLTNLPAVQYT